jgi:hypothetical protein
MAGRKRDDAVIHGFQQEGMQVYEIAGDVERRDLPRAFRRQFVSGSEPVNEQAAVAGPRSLDHQVLSSQKAPFTANDAPEDVALFIGDKVMLFQIEK